MALSVIAAQSQTTNSLVPRKDIRRLHHPIESGEKELKLSASVDRRERRPWVGGVLVTRPGPFGRGTPQQRQASQRQVAAGAHVALLGG
eukprot:8111983-Lingulodinium_polyedra.AAC.1